MRRSTSLSAFAGLVALLPLAACTSSVDESDTGSAANTGSENASALRVCTGDLSGRRLADETGLALAKGCIEDGPDGIKIAVVDKVASGDAAGKRVVIKGKTTVEVRDHVRTYRAEHAVTSDSPFAGRVAVGSTVRYEVRLEEKVAIRHEGSMQDHFLGDFAWAVTSPDGKKGPAKELSKVHFYSETPDPHLHWNYSSSEGGTSSWGELKPEYETCSDGKRQSPIDLSSSETPDSTVAPEVELHWAASATSLVNNGHALQANVASGSYLTLGGTRFDLLQFHVHTPSEHIFDGKAAGMEVHFVHRSAEGKLAVVGVLVDTGKTDSPGANALLADFPPKVNEPVELQDKLDPNAFLPAKRTAFTYAGSLTTPPCSEDVTWLVLEGRVTASEKQRERVEELIGSKNARHVDGKGMPRHDRKVGKVTL